MHSKSFLRVFRMFMVVAASTFLVAACGQGSGPAKIPGNPAPPPPPPPPSNCADAIDFEDACGPFAFNDFGGGASAVIDNPDVSGINTTAKVAQLQKFDAEVFGGSTLALAAPVDFSGGEFFTVKVRASRAVPLLFKFEGLNQERTENHSGSGSWEQLCFDFSGSTAGAPATDITFIFDLGVLGDATNNPDDWTFQVDGIEQATSCAGGGGPGTLVFADEFDTGSTPDPTFWNLETGYGPNNDGWGNNEWQNYTNLPENVRVENGNLVISALCPSGTCGVRDGTVTSARINTKDKFEFRYGRVEARIQMPDGPAIWPAFWALGANLDDVGWPNAGEIDFTEVFNTNSDVNTTHFSMFWCDESLTAPNPCSDVAGGRASSTDTFRLNESLGNDFHVYSAEWNENQITGMIDGITYFVRDIDPGTMEEFQRNFFLLFNVAMGGAAGSANQPPDGSEVFPQTMLVDYVRVYDAEVGAGSGEDTVIDFERDPVSYDFGMDGGFGGGASSVIANPEQNGINTSAQVGQMLKFAGEVFGGSTLALPSPLQITAAGNFTMKVWSPRAVNVLLKVEGPVESEVEIAHGGSGWEELTFDFSSFTGQVNGITLIFDLGTVGNADNDPDNWTFYFDDITIPTGTSGGGGGGGGGTGSLLADFEDAGAPYVFNDFEGGVGSVIDNPDATGINTSAKVGQMQKFAGAAFGGTTLTLANTVDIEAGSVFTMKVWSQRAVPVLFKLEGGPVAEVSANHGGTGWEELTFDFSAVSGNGTNAITLIFDLGTSGDAENDPTNWTFYFDDITIVPPGGGGGGGGGGSSSVDFEGGSYTFNDFGGAVAAVIANPDASGINTSGQVAQMQKFAGETFAGSTLDLGGAVPLADGDSYTMKVRSQRSVVVTLKLEPLNVETTATHSGSGTWEELCFDFTGVSGNVTGLTVIFDNGTAGDAANDPDNWTFQYDDIEQTASCGGGGGGGGGSGIADIDFETPATGAGFTWNTFENADNPPVTLVANPDTSGANPSATVASFTARAGGQPFAGAETAHGDIGPLTLDATNSIIKVMVYKTVISDVGIKFAINNGGAQPEIKVPNTVVNQWEELTFDFSGNIGLFESIDIDQLIVFPDFAARGQDNVVYFDNIRFTGSGGGGGGGTSLDFEDDPASYDFGPDGGFGGGAASVIANPQSNGINTSAQTGQMQKFAGEVFGGATLFLASPLDIPANSEIKMKVFAQRAVPVLFKLEGGPVAEVSVTHTGSGWEELTFDFSTISGSITGITLIFDLGVNGDAANDPANWTFLFDDIVVVAAGGGGGGGGSGIADIDFETPATGAGFTWNTFENADNPPVTLVANPDTSGANPSATVASFTARAGGQPFAGAETAHGDIGPLTLDATNSIIKVMVYKTVISDVGIKFAINNGGAQPEIKVPNTVVNQWEELTFDFSGNIGLFESIDIDQLIVFPDFAARGQDNVVLFDNIRFTDGSGGGGGGGGTSLDFEDDPASYDFGPDGGFGGGAASVIANPQSNGINTSAQTGQMQKFAGEVFGGATLFLASPLDIPANSEIKMKVFAQRAVPVLFKLEGGPVAEVSVTHTGSGWEELTFDFSTISGSITGITLIFDLGVNGDAANDPNAWTFLFDDIVVAAAGGGGGGGGASSTDFEGGSYTFNDFGGAVAAVVPNPDASGINTSGQVAQMQKFAGETFAGSTLDLGGAVALAAGDSYRMKVRATRSVVVTLKLEPLNVETTATHSGSGTWEELCFDFTGVSGNVTGLTVIFDNGTAGDAANDPANWTFQYDDIEQTASCGGGGGGGGTTSLDFEDDLNSYDFGPDGGFGGGAASVIANPQSNGINTSAQVGQMQKFAGEVFGGATLFLAGPLDIPANSEIKMKVWSQRSVPVLFKLEGGPVAEVSVTHSGSGWEELTFDFSAVSGSITGITLIFDLGVNGDAATDPTNWTFYFDDIVVGPAGGGGGSTYEPPEDFEGDPASYDFGPDGGFGGGAASIIANPQSNGINTSAQVGQMQKFAGEVFGGATLALGSPLDIPANSNATMKVWSQRSVPVLFKLEGGPVAEISVTHTGSGWEELTFDFSAISGSITGITLIFDLGVNGDAATDPTNWTFYFDDIAFVAAGGGGGGGGPTGLADIDFESAATGTGLTWTVFENADNPPVTLIANPVPGGVNTSATVASITARVGGQPFAGTETAHGDIGPLTLDASNSIIKIMVYKTVISDVGIKFAINNGGAQPEIKVPNTVVNQWEELTFDYSGNIGLFESIDIDQLIIFPDFNARSQDNVVLFDNIRFTDGT